MQMHAPCGMLGNDEPPNLNSRPVVHHIIHSRSDPRPAEFEVIEQVRNDVQIPSHLNSESYDDRDVDDVCDVDVLVD